MKFLYPEFLLALFAVAIPIIIHLFNFRKFRKVFYSDIQLLKELKIETKSRARLKHWLILICRIFAICFLVFAFAQPYIPLDNQVVRVGNKAVSIYVDNSFSTEANGDNGTILQQEKERAQDIVDEYESADRFHLITNDFEGHLQRTFSKEEMAFLIEEIKVSPVSRNLSEVILRQQDILNNSDIPNKQAYLLSDFQTTVSDFHAMESDTGISTRLMPFEALNQSNFYIDSVWFQTPHRQNFEEETIIARIVNISDKDAEVRVELDINGKNQGFNNYIIPSNNFSDCEFHYTVFGDGIQEGILRLADYPDLSIDFDDNFYFSYNIAKNINILIVSDEIDDTSSGLGAILGSVPKFNLRFNRSSEIIYSEFANDNLIILRGLKSISSGLNSELSKFIGNGGNVLLIPNPEIDINSYNSFLNNIKAGTIVKKDTNLIKVKEMNLSHPLFKDIFEKIPKNVDLPLAKSHYKIGIPTKSNHSYLMRLQNGDPYLTEHSYQDGHLYLSAVATDDSFGNFVKHATVLAGILRIAEFSQENQQLYGIIGKDNSIKLKNKKIRPENSKIAGNGIEFIPQINTTRGTSTLILHDQIQSASNYRLFDGNSHLRSYGWNYNRNESDPKTLSISEIGQQVKENKLDQTFNVIETTTSSPINKLNNLAGGEKYWKWFIILVLLALALEILIYRIFK